VSLPADSPGSAGEHALQGEYGTADRAARFYPDQVRGRLLPRMIGFLERAEMLFVATATGTGSATRPCGRARPVSPACSTTGRSPTPSTAGTGCTRARATSGQERVWGADDPGRKDGDHFRGKGTPIAVETHTITGSA
jgi:hypothetical protein